MKLWLPVIAITLNACTLAPQPVHPTTASSWIVAHRVGYDNNGYFVDAEWLRSYESYYANYGTKLPIREQVKDPNEGISTVNGRYHVSFETNRRMDHMIEIERTAGP